MKDLTSKKADLTLFFVAFIWGTGFIVTKTALDIYTPSQLSFLRFGIASLVALIVFRKDMKNINKSDIKAGVIMGVFLAIGFIFQTIGLQGTSAGNSAFLTGTNVVMVPFFYYMVTKIKPGRNNVIAAVLMFLGIILLTVDLENFGKFNLWDFLTLLSAISFAWQVVVIGIFASDKNPAVISTLQNVTCAVIFLILFLFEGEPLVINGGGSMSILYLSLVNTFVCFLLQTIGQKYTSATHAAIILSLESVFGSLLGVLILKETYTAVTIVGFVIIFLAVLSAEVGFNWMIKDKQ